MWRLVARLGPYRGRVALGLLSLLAVDLVVMWSPRVLGGEIDRLARDDGSRLSWSAATLLAIGVTSAGLRFGWRWCLIGASRALRRDLRQQLYQHLARLHETAAARRPVGAMLSLASSDIEAVQMACGFGFLAAADALILLVIGLVMLIDLSPPLTAAALAPLPVLALVAWLGGRVIHRRATTAQESTAAFAERVRESLAGARVIKAHGRDDAFLAALAEANQRQLADQLALVRWSAMIEPLAALLAGVAVVVVLLYGGSLVLGGALGLGDFVAFTGCLSLLAWPMSAVGMVVNLARRGTAALDRLEAVQREPIEADPLDAVAAPSDDAVAAHALTFTYPGASRPALTEVSFALPAGATLGIVGPTGAGKSTLAHLLLRVHEPPPGTLTLGGVDLARIRRAEVRRAIVAVPQEPAVFSTSVRENIAFGRVLDDAAVAHAADGARIADEIAAMPQGYATMLGERGLTLSGGQRQRVTLARALARDPRVLLLDDALSSVDARTEAAIVVELRRRRAGRATIIIAHRASAVRHADLIIVLDHGRISEHGTHADLLAAGGWYARLARLQQAVGEGDEA